MPPEVDRVGRLVGGNVRTRCLLAHIPAALLFREALQQGLDTLLVRAGRINRPLLLQGAHFGARSVIRERYVWLFRFPACACASLSLVRRRNRRNRRKIWKVL